jgi:hypothetical protein
VRPRDGVVFGGHRDRREAERVEELREEALVLRSRRRSASANRAAKAERGPTYPVPLRCVIPRSWKYPAGQTECPKGWGFFATRSPTPRLHKPCAEKENGVRGETP